MKRRKFLWIGLAGTAAMSIPSLQCREPSAEINDILSRPEMLSRISDEASLRQIGMQYRSQFRAGDPSNLRQNLLKGAESTSSTDLRAALEKKIRDDFSQNRVVRVDGWIISETEARQCALLSFNKVSQ